VLQWIADGCPNGVWPDNAHKISARALEARGLAGIVRRGGRWHAEIKPDGARYLEHGDYPSAPDSTIGVPRAAVARRSHPRPSLSGEELVAQLQSRPEKKLCVKVPSNEVRAAYRHAIHDALSRHLAPAGLALRHTGRDTGDLVIRLVNATEQPSTPRAVPVPSGYDRHQDAITALLHNPQRLPVSPEARARALTLVQALADEGERRGYRLEATTEPGAAFQVVIGADVFAFILTEEDDVVDEVLDEDAALAKYAWQRVSPRQVYVPSRRLRLELLRGRNHRKWADRKRWRLDEKLPAVLAHIEEESQHEHSKREAIRAEHQRQVDLWHAAVAVARKKYLAGLNQRRLNEQLQAWNRAEDIRRYCTHLESIAAARGGEVRTGVGRWVAWGRRYADSLDPVFTADELCLAEPDEIPAQELDEYMPKGMTIRHPPLPPDFRT
jgi:hypothetical protein